MALSSKRPGAAKGGSAARRSIRGGRPPRRAPGAVCSPAMFAAHRKECPEADEPALFAARRRRFLEAMEPGSIAILLGAGLATRSRDTHYRFRQDSDFHYLTGFDHPNAALVLRNDGRPPFTLFVEPRDPEAETWTGYRPGVEGARADFGADEAHPIGELLAKLPGLLEGARRVYHVLGRDPRVDQRIVET